MPMSHMLVRSMHSMLQKLGIHNLTMCVTVQPCDAFVATRVSGESYSVEVVAADPRVWRQGTKICLGSCRLLPQMDDGAPKRYAFWHTLLQRKHKHVVEGFLIASMNQTYFCPLFSHPSIARHYFDGIWFPTHTSRNKCVARLHCDAHCQVVDAQLLPHRMHRPDQHMRHGHALLGV